MDEPSVLLVNPNRMRPLIAPLALDYLAAALTETGIAVSLLDLAFAESVEAGTACLEACHRFDVVGVTVRNLDDCYFASRDFVLAQTRDLIRRLKQVYDVPLVVGGVGFSTNPVAALEFLEADYGVVGDGEDALSRLVWCLHRNESPGGIPGVIRPTTDPETMVRAVAPLGRDLSARCFLDNGRYFREGGQAGIETKRGCDGTCLYCADPVAKGHRVRLRPPENVAQEAASLRRQGITHWHTCDSEFNRPPGHALAVCQALVDARLGGALRWYAYCSPVPFSAELCRSMRRAGCVGINFGVDAGDDTMLRRLGRDHHVSDVEAAVASCRREGVAVMVDLLLGGPEETPATVARTIETMKRLDPDRVGVSLGMRVYPGTPLANWLQTRALPRHRLALRGDLDAYLGPTFYLAPDLGDDPFGVVAAAIGNDERFFFVAPDAADRDYNYNDNEELVHAIAAGYRGAYWDILRRLRRGLPPDSPPRGSPGEAPHAR